MIYFFYTIHFVICLFLILVVLLQQGKGADLSVFGGGGTMTAFGARGAATLLHKMTVIGFVGFIITTLAIGILQKQDSGSTVMSGVPIVEETIPAAADEVDEGALPEDDAEGDAGILPEAEEFDGEAAAAAANDGETADSGEAADPGEDESGDEGEQAGSGS